MKEHSLGMILSYDRKVSLPLNFGNLNLAVLSWSL